MDEPALDTSHLGVPYVNRPVRNSFSIDDDHPLPNRDPRSAQHPPQPESIINCAFLTELLSISDTKNLLKLRLLDKAELFLEPATLKALRCSTYSWLGDALLDLRANGMMKMGAMLGLIVAMTALGEVTCSHVGTFIVDLDP